MGQIAHHIAGRSEGAFADPKSSEPISRRRFECLLTLTNASGDGGGSEPKRLGSGAACHRCRSPLAWIRSAAAWLWTRGATSMALKLWRPCWYQFWVFEFVILTELYCAGSHGVVSQEASCSSAFQEQPNLLRNDDHHAFLPTVKPSYLILEKHTV